MAITDLDPKALVEAHNRGDDDAFAAIVRLHHGSLLAHAVSRLHDRQAAEDAVQETFVRAHRALPRFEGDFQLRAWLHRILTNVCHDEGSRRRRDGLLLERVAAQADVGSAAADAEIERLDVGRGVVAAALAALPDSYREALVLRDVQELSYEEVAAATGVTTGNARVRVMRGRAALKRALTTSHAAFLGLLPFLRRGGRGPSAVADLPSLGAASASASASASLAAGASSASAPTLLAATQHAAAGSPLLLRAADAAPQVAERVASIPQVLGLVATMAVPIAAPVVSDQVAGWVVRPPAAVAGPAVDAVTASAPPDAPDAPPAAPDTTAAPRALVVHGAAEPAVTTTSTPSTTAPQTTTTAAPAPTTTAPPAVKPATGTTPSSTTPTSASPSTTAPPPAPVRRSATLTGDQLTSVGDEEVELAGPVRWVVGGEVVQGHLQGVLAFDRPAGGPAPVEGGRDGEAAPRSRRFTGELEVQLADGRSYRLVLAAGELDDPSAGTGASAEVELLDACGSTVATGSLAGELDLQAAPLPSALDLTLDGSGPADLADCG